ncbi:hypothetical protein JTB14_028199 [Gonioctena quinquepunctata]|nr:hypothetical protein JTB14_028199 [Gonioctena quinquepunctata]
MYTRTTGKRNKLLPRFIPRFVKSNNPITVTATCHKKNIKHKMKKKTDPRTMLQMDPGDGTRDKILDLKENPGILPLKLGPAKIQTSTFIHYYNLTPIKKSMPSKINMKQLPYQ